MNAPIGNEIRLLVMGDSTDIYGRWPLSTGRGRFGTVFRGIWHGEVAVKMLDMDHGGTPENQINQLAAFKSEVRAAFKSEVRAGSASQ